MRAWRSRFVRSRCKSRFQFESPNEILVTNGESMRVLDSERIRKDGRDRGSFKIVRRVFFHEIEAGHACVTQHLKENTASGFFRSESSGRSIPGRRGGGARKGTRPSAFLAVSKDGNRFAGPAKWNNTPFVAELRGRGAYESATPAKPKTDFL